MSGNGLEDILYLEWLRDVINTTHVTGLLNTEFIVDSAEKDYGNVAQFRG